MPPKFVICEEKVCTTCHLTLPRSAYYTQRRHQYGRCKSCENKRLAKYRAEKKLADNDLQGEKRCEACQKIVPMKQIADYGICRVVCVFHTIEDNCAIRSHTLPSLEMVNADSVQYMESLTIVPFRRRHMHFFKFVYI